MFRMSLRPLVVLCLCSASWSFNFGLGAPLTSLWLRDAYEAGTLPGLAAFASAFEIDIDTVIGLNTSIYYLGIALAASQVPRCMRRWGRRCPAMGMVASGLAVAALPWAGHVSVWFLLRFLHGVAGAMSLVPLETFINRHSPSEQRARNFGCYAFAVALGWALGNLVGLQMYPDAPSLALVLGGMAGVLAAGILTFLPWPAEPPLVHQERTAIGLRRYFLSYGSAWSQGFLEGGMVAFMAVYLLYLGLSENRVSWLTSGIMMGVILFQVPIAWLADRLSRTAVLLGCYAVAGVGLASLPWCGDSVWLMLWLFLVGACSGAFYPLGLAILGEELPPTQLARASAWFLTINCCGSLVGPVLSGRAMDYFGKPAMFVTALAALAAVVMGWAVSRSRPGKNQHADTIAKRAAA